MVNIHYPIVAAINATAQTFVLGFAGVLLSWFKVRTRQVFDAAGADSLGKLTMMLFLPALMFTTLIDDISDSDINTLFEVLLYTTSSHYAVHVVIGLTIGTVFGYVLKAKPDVRHLMATCLGKG